MKESLKNSLLVSTLALASCEKPEGYIEDSRAKAKAVLNEPRNDEVISYESENELNLPPQRIEISQFRGNLERIKWIYEQGEEIRMEKEPIEENTLPRALYEEFKKYLSHEGQSLVKFYSDKETDTEIAVKFNLLQDKDIKVDGGSWSFILSPDGNSSDIPEAAMAILPIEQCTSYFRNKKTGREFYFDSGVYNKPCPPEGVMETLTSITNN